MTKITSEPNHAAYETLRVISEHSPFPCITPGPRSDKLPADIQPLVDLGYVVAVRIRALVVGDGVWLMGCYITREGLKELGNYEERRQANQSNTKERKCQE